jgi:hypothetical protein
MQTIGRKIHHDSSFPPLRFVFAITLSTYTQGYLCYPLHAHALIQHLQFTNESFSYLKTCWSQRRKGD